MSKYHNIMKAADLTVEKNRMKKLNAYQLKLIMAFLMLLDHLHYIHNFISPDMAAIFTVISRCVAPMFAYFAVEGIIHTRDTRKYCLRLFLWAGLMFAGNAALNIIFKIFSKSLSVSEQAHLYTNNNVIFTLALGVLCIILLSEGKEKKSVVKYGFVTGSVICFIIGFLFSEWGSVIVPFMLVTYFFRDRKILRFAGYAIIEIIAILLPFGEPLYIIVFPFILLYNGERGKNTLFTKYFFYVFYLIHLWLIAIVNFIVMTR